MPTATGMSRMPQASTTHADFVHIRKVLSLSFHRDQRRTLRFDAEGMNRSGRKGLKSEGLPADRQARSASLPHNAPAAARSACAARRWRRPLRPRRSRRRVRWSHSRRSGRRPASPAAGDASALTRPEYHRQSPPTARTYQRSVPRLLSAMRFRPEATGQFPTGQRRTGPPGR